MTHIHQEPDDRTPVGGLGEGAIHGLLGYQLAQATIVTTQAFERVVGGPFTLRPVEFTILQLIHENAGASASNLARALAITLPGVKVWIDRLEHRRLLRRERHDSDRRSHKLQLTREGTKLLATTRTRLLDEDQKVLRELSAGERTILLELLHKVARTRTHATSKGP
jgi:DNA-binding MarR family transcriptional regulator